MTTKAQLGIGTFLQYGDNSASPETFTTLAEVKDGPTWSVTRELLEVTNQDSPNQSREYILGLKDGSEFTVTCNMAGDGTGTGDAGHHESHDVVLGIQEAGTARTWRVLETLANSDIREWRFEALVLGYEVDASPGTEKTVAFTFKITGDVTRYNQ